jgi:hypothetical protein
LEIHLNFQLHPTEPANYRDSYTTASKEIVDTEIGMCLSDGIIMTDITITAAIEATAKLSWNFA